MNVCKLMRRKAELEARLRNANVDILLLQETKLSDDVEEVRVAGFYLVGRLDRSTGPKAGFGGVAVYARNSISNIALLSYSDSAERMWCILHTNLGAVLIGNWYRAPDARDFSIRTLTEKLSKLRVDLAIGVILAGDVNIHHRKWLRHSRENSAIGELLWNISREEGLKQLVSDPTRGNYLLDIVLADVGEMLKVSVLSSLADHRVVCMDMNVVIARTCGISREVWNLQRADWNGLKFALKQCQCGSFLKESHVDESVDKFCNHLCDVCSRFIPKNIISIYANAHPWLDDDCFRAIEAKCLATSRDDFLEKQRRCAEVLSRKFKEYHEALKDRIRNLKKSSKLLWKLNRELLCRKSKCTSIPPLKARDGSWCLNPTDKANLLASTFQGKCHLPPGDWRPGRRCEESQHSQMSDFCLIRCRWAAKIIKALDANKSSGPDLLPIRFFKECVKELSPALAVLARFLLRCRRWPQRWRIHWVHPLHNKSAVCQPSNYRGIL